MGSSLKLCFLLLLCLSWMALSGCTTAKDPQWDNPVIWGIKVVAPQHYEVWVDKFFVESLSEDIGWRAPIGSIGCCWKSPRGKGAKWETTPEVFIIEWFSFAEQQRYRIVFEVEDPEGLFAKMQEPAPVMVRGEKVNMPRDLLVLGLAPGGQVVMWIMNWEQTAIEVGRYQAHKIDTPPGYHQEWIDNYQRDHGAYLQQHGLQLDKW